MKFFGTKDIKYYVARFFLGNKELFSGKVVVDIPAGTGVSSAALLRLGADVRPYDLFPDLFRVAELSCGEADLSAALPIGARSADCVLCQEGIEHIPDQMFLLKELNRVLKPKGRLFLTTPNYSNLRSRFSYLACESELFLKIMPPNELDSVWLSEKNKDKIYYGHIFSIGLLKLRTLAKLNGFRLVKMHETRVNYTSLALLFVLYPLILVINLLAYFRSVRKNKSAEKGLAKEVYGELLRLAINPAALTSGHLFVEFEKEKEPEEVSRQLHAIHQQADFTT